MAATVPFREALNESISSGRFEDTKLLLYSRRDSSGNVCGPKALYASSHVLKSVSYFDALFSGNFVETEPKDFSEAFDGNDVAQDYGYHSDSDLEDDDIHFANSKESRKTTAPPTENKLLHPHGEYRECPQGGKVVKIQDVAFITFQAFLLYLYTGYVEFAPYGSEKNRKSRVTEISSTSNDTIPRPSPKSVYRLADKYDIPSLRQLALDNIKQGVKQCDIVEEAFSQFTSKYAEVRTVQIDHLVSLWSSRGRDKSMVKMIDEKVDSYANGELDHAMEAMALLWECSRKNRDPAKENQNMALSWPTSNVSPPDVNWKLLKTSLIKSIRHGVFLDRRYWTRHSVVSRPIYISSIIVDKKLRFINDLLELRPGGEYPANDYESEDSDCESNSEQPVGFALESQVWGNGKSLQELRPVLTIGSFTSWISLFFYLCTGEIQFAPIKSQGASVRARYVREKTTPEKPAPCSPKAIYSLAAALEIKSLRVLAFNEMQSKVTSVGAAAELFSEFVSKESDVMKMYCELLSHKFREERVTASVADSIKTMAGGKAAYRATALKLALRHSCSEGVLLRCPIRSCVNHDNPVSYRSLGTNLWCPEAHWFSFKCMECANCGEMRSGGYFECRRCGEWFR